MKSRDFETLKTHQFNIRNNLNSYLFNYKEITRFESLAIYFSKEEKILLFRFEIRKKRYKLKLN